MRSFLTRLLVAAIAIPALLFVFYQGGEWLRILVAVLIILGMIEAQRLSAKAGAVFPVSLSMLGALLVPWLSAGLWQGLSWPAWIALTLVISAIPVVRGQEIRTLAAGVAAQMVIVLWVGLGLGALVAIRSYPDTNGFGWLLLLFANLWVGDTAAYLFGVWLGKTKLSPMVSPKKTVAGAIAQIIASAAVGIVFVAAGWIAAPAALIIAASLVIGVVGQMGDLFESVLKRAAGEKDSSALIPGHGGVLDRFDSTLFAAPSLYALLQMWPR
jgi:phosphatidate cytidylyltransferase